MSLNQIFNCDETGLNFRLLPDSTLAAGFEKSAAGRKKSKDRVTLNLCSNASGTIKLPVHLIGKAKRPRCFKDVNMKLLPVKYTNQKNAWMTAEQFTEWFHHDFVPYVREHLKSLGEEPKAVLLLDNCSAHPEEADLTSDDGAITAVFLPPNVTALIQPMDQGVIQAIKKRYKKKLLGRLIIQEESGMSIVTFLKKITLKVVVDLVAQSWAEIEPTTLRKSWRKILPEPTISTASGAEFAVPEPCLAELYKLAVAEDPEDSLQLTETSQNRGCGLWHGIRVRIGNSDDKLSADSGSVDEDDVSIDSFQAMFHALGAEVESSEIADWLDSDKHDSGIQEDEICDIVSQHTTAESEEDEANEEEEEPCPVSHGEAARMLEWCLTWLEHQPEATVYNTTVLRELQTMATKKKINSLKQTKLDHYFQS